MLMDPHDLSSSDWFGRVGHWRAQLSWVDQCSVLIWSDQVKIGFFSARPGLGPIPVIQVELGCGLISTGQVVFYPCRLDWFIVAQICLSCSPKLGCVVQCYVKPSFEHYKLVYSRTD